MTSSSLTYSTILKALFPFLFQLTDRRRKVVGNNVFLTSNFFLLWKRIINIIYIYIFTEFNFTEFNFLSFSEKKKGQNGREMRVKMGIRYKYISRTNERAYSIKIEENSYTREAQYNTYLNVISNYHLLILFFRVDALQLYLSLN